MKRHRTFILIALGFIVLSAVLYTIHFLIFRDAHHIFIYMLGDLAFVPLEVFLVVIVVERLLARREKRAMMTKLNMVVGAFFSEVGLKLLGELKGALKDAASVIPELCIGINWGAADFKNAAACARSIHGQFESRQIDLQALRDFLAEKRTFMLALLENPNLLEHEGFTDLLWATLHLQEELDARPGFDNLPAADLNHLSVDIERVFDHLALEWVSYAEHLKANYPFLFAYIVRTHPLQEHPDAVLS
jgi:hypothetical protein